MRTGGVLLPIFSLPSPYGIGSLGQHAFEFIRFLKEAGQSIWQILPLSPTGHGNSPYQSFSSFGGNPYLIDIDLLTQQGLLEKDDYINTPWGNDPEKIDYGLLYKNRWPLLKKAGENFLGAPPEDYVDFKENHRAWLPDYALFMALKEAHSNESWESWPKALRFREPQAMEKAKEKYAQEICFWECIQYLFFTQWDGLKTYAHKNGVSLMGDIPFYAAFDSADCWAHPEVFQLDENLLPTAFAGVPPDSFTDAGQCWGNPLFRWDVLKATHYRWWMQRLAHSARLFDSIRMDHFRGFDSYYSIPSPRGNPLEGHWEQGPGLDFFSVLHKELGELSLIAEDLGHLTPQVHQLVEATGYPGMKVLQFAFGEEANSPYLPHNYPPHCVAYTGTHDNPTNLGWLETASVEEISFAFKYLRLQKEEGTGWGIMKSLWASTANTVILQAQDLLGIGGSGRTNTPSTTEDNWQWRALPKAFSAELAQKFHSLMKLYRRI